MLGLLAGFPSHRPVRNSSQAENNATAGQNTLLRKNVLTETAARACGQLRRFFQRSPGERGSWLRLLLGRLEIVQQNV